MRMLHRLDHTTCLLLLTQLFFCDLSLSKHGHGGTETADEPPDVSSGVPNSSSVPQPSGTPSVSNSTSSQPGQSVTLDFSTPPNGTSCMPMTFEWTISPDNITNVFMDLDIIDIDIAQSNLPMNINQTISSHIPIQTGKLVWPAVTVPSGQYIAEARVEDSATSISWNSHSFFIASGSNTSCVVLGNGTAAVSPSGSSSTTGSSVPTRLSPGVLAGIIIGAIVVILTLMMALSAPRIWKRKQITGGNREYVVF